MDISELTVKDADIIENTFLFRGESRDFILRALGDGRCILSQSKKGEVIFDSGSFLRSIGILLSGEILVRKPAASHGYVMKRIGSGGVFGAAALFSDEPYVSVLTAVKDCRVLFLSQELIVSLLRENPESALSYIGFLSGRIRFLNGKISGLLSGSAESAVAEFLLSSNENPVNCGSLKEMSARLNIGRTSLYRVLGSLEERGIIKKGGKRIEILDAAALGQKQNGG